MEHRGTARKLWIGGWGGIRTPGGREPTPVFKTGALNHSATHPLCRIRRLAWSLAAGNRKLAPDSRLSAPIFPVLIAVTTARGAAVQVCQYGSVRFQTSLMTLAPCADAHYSILHDRKNIASRLGSAGSHAWETLPDTVSQWPALRPARAAIIRILQRSDWCSREGRRGNHKAVS